MPAAKKPPRPPAIIVQRDNPLKPAQVKDGLKQLGPDDALPMQALQHVIDQLLLAQINEVADPKTADATITVLHNGVKIHDAVQLPKGTGIGGTRPEVPRGPIIFQGHGNPVNFRNVWILEK